MPATGKKADKPKKVAAAPSHPPMQELIAEAIIATGKRGKGSSSVAIRKYLEGKYGSKLNSRFATTLRLALKRNVSSGVLLQTKASYRLAKKPATQKKKKE
eukprot:NODE_4419_length_811_cov_32.081365_g4085_i0.p2 GENE.NODE_4419_length_811_cov_32.081365_g4085_i0~~NODE_4419_length_811_cov_32.081365_g4085_i0.p2  ORF type:complete len:101 (-),score=21.98 NODE_4419_length_811_cov_32.081365_g4085_i0:382-684(-)